MQFQHDSFFSLSMLVIGVVISAWPISQMRSGKAGIFPPVTDKVTDKVVLILAVPGAATSESWRHIWVNQIIIYGDKSFVCVHNTCSPLCFAGLFAFCLIYLSWGAIFLKKWVYITGRNGMHFLSEIIVCHNISKGCFKDLWKINFWYWAIPYWYSGHNIGSSAIRIE